ncbi:TonB-dependent receptor [Bacteroides sp. 3_1_13]|uniref:TonB-dependent receptor n=1 Tax=Bacteroides sp. 3_1_13 TaxID=457389 RepID=UPI000671DAAD|nr:TonB-dependent receptor [Bacteroides sp. 3_1_13]KMW80021.1 TonB-dependent receptor [Bacteroides sp. 3_1_13]
MRLRTGILFLLGMLLLSPVCHASDDQKATIYPAEALELRLNRIAKTYKVEVVFDGKNMKAISVPATTKRNSVEVDLSNSLSNTDYSYKKVSAESYSVYQDDNKNKKSSGKGTITGTVLDKDGFPIPGATVVIVGSNTGAATDIRGNFTLKDVSARTYTVEVSCISYQKMRVSDVKVAGGRTTPLDVILQDETEMLNEVVVTATYNKASANALYSKQKTMVAMSDGLSADLIKKTSDNNMAQVLRRVSGVTIDNGKYVNVRGMGERYNNVQLNGASLPSTEPNRRNFAFDVIPSGLVDNVTIAKTFTPDLPGEFTGGLVEVNTLAVPEKKFVNISLGTGMNTQSTGKDFLSNKRFKSDYLFGEVNDRQWFAGRESGELSGQNAALKNTFGMQRFTAAPIQNYSITIGAPIELGYGHKLGVVAALTYRNEQTIEDYVEMTSIDKDSLNGPGKRYKFVTSTGAVANVGWETQNHKITWRNMFNNRYSHTNMERYIRKYTTSFDTYEQYSVPLRSRLWQTQLEGEHKLFNEKLIATWNASYNQVERTNPDDRYALGNVMGKVEDGLVSWASSITSSQFDIKDGHLMYSNLEEKKKNIGVNLEHPFIVSGNRQAVKAGYMGTFRTSAYDQQYLHGMFNREGEGYDAWVQLRQSNSELNELYDPKNFASGAIFYELAGLSSVSKADYYEGKQDIHAAYLMGEFTFLRKFHLTTGVRMENANTEVFTQFYERNQQKLVDSLVTVKKTDWLPAATLVYNITDNINARFAYSRTIARPDFRELTPCNYYNVDDRVEVRGVGGLRQSHSDNFDFRLEWYPQAGEVLSVSAFYKKFKDPVEMVTRVTSDGNYILYPFNIDNANVKGIEINMRKSLGFFAPASFLKNLYLSGNVTFLKGDVTYNLDKLYGTTQEIKTQDRSRPLQGLAPYTVNVGLTYQDKMFGAALNYGRSGRKLVLAGNYAKFDQYEAPRNVLDLQLSARFLKERLEVKFNASDLLNQDIIVYRNCGNDPLVEDPNGGAYEDLTSDMNYNSGDWVLSRIKKGINLSLSVGYRF